MKKIEFFSSIDGVADVFPIIPAEDKLPDWVNACRQDFKVKAMQSNNRFLHTYRCPGIHEILTTGYLVTMPWDVIIETNGDPWNFKWTVPDVELATLMGDTPIIVPHNETAVHLPVPPNALSSIIKLATPWHIKTPNNIKLLVLPLSYTNTFEYQHVPGILEPALSTEINIMLRWFVKNGTVKIKAGTPVAHLIPLSDEKFNLECRDANAWDKLWIQKRRYLQNLSFSVNRLKLREAYKAHFK